MTAKKTLLDSCGIIFNEQGISLLYDAQNNTAIDQSFIKVGKKTYHLSIWYIAQVKLYTFSLKLA